MSLLCISQVTAGSAVQACLTTAMDNLAAAPASLRKAPRATFCFAWHTDAPADKLLEWLQVNVQWAARALQWSDSYQLHSSAPENDADMPLPTASVVLASATLLAESEEYSAAESSISEVCLCICRHNHPCCTTCVVQEDGEVVPAHSVHLSLCPPSFPLGTPAH